MDEVLQPPLFIPRTKLLDALACLDLTSNQIIKLHITMDEVEVVYIKMDSLSRRVYDDMGHVIELTMRIPIKDV